MRARLFTRVGPFKGASHEIGEEADIGRGEECAIFLDHGLISTRHARIAYDSAARAYCLEDLGSLNGTAVDGIPVSGRERLGRLHVITLAGKLDFVFQDFEESATPSSPVEAEVEVGDQTFIDRDLLPLPGPLLSGRTGSGSAAGKDPVDHEKTFMDRETVPTPPIFDLRKGLSAPPASLDPAARAEGNLSVADRPGLGQVTEIKELDDLFASGLRAIESRREERPSGDRRFHLKMLSKRGKPKFIELRPGENLVGRGTDATIRIDDPELSRRHATLIVDGDQVRLRDEGSHNGTFLEDEPVHGERSAAVGCRLRFGNREAWLVESSRQD